MKTPPLILLACDGGPGKGLGHVARSRALAAAFRDLGARAALALPEDSPALAALPAREPAPLCFGSGRSGELADRVRHSGASALVLDLPGDLEAGPLRSLRGEGRRLACVDYASGARLACDLAFYPPVPQARRLDWRGSDTRVRIGPQWVVLGPGALPPPGPRPSLERPRILVTMGGSDPARLGLRALAALARLGDGFDTVCVAGPACSFRDELAAALATLPRPGLLAEAPEGLAPLLASCTLAVASFGVTAWELAAAGVPAIHLCLSPDHAESARALHEAGAARSLGHHPAVEAEDLARAVESLLENPPALEEMSRRGRTLVDGRGAWRVAAEILGPGSGRTPDDFLAGAP